MKYLNNCWEVVCAVGPLILGIVLCAAIVFYWANSDYIIKEKVREVLVEEELIEE